MFYYRANRPYTAKVIKHLRQAKTKTIFSARGNSPRSLTQRYEIIITADTCRNTKKGETAYIASIPATAAGKASIQAAYTSKRRPSRLGKAACIYSAAWINPRECPC